MTFLSFLHADLICCHVCAVFGNLSRLVTFEAAKCLKTIHPYQSVHCDFSPIAFSVHKETELATRSKLNYSLINQHFIGRGSHFGFRIVLVKFCVSLTSLKRLPKLTWIIVLGSRKEFFRIAANTLVVIREERNVVGISYIPIKPVS